LISGRNIGIIAIGFSGLYALFYFKKSMIPCIKFVALASIPIFGYSFFVGLTYGFNIKIMCVEFYYYLKPFVFYIFGLSSIITFRKSFFLKNLIPILMIGTLLFVLFPIQFVEAAHAKSGIGRGWGHFISFKYFLRSGSFFLSPLETAFVSSFLGIYFFYYRSKFRFGKIYFLLATYCLLLSITRSVILIYGVSILFLFLSTSIGSTGRNMKWIIPTIVSLIIVGAGWYAKGYLIKYDGSIMLHFDNLNTTLAYLIKNPWGYGMSSSGYTAVMAGRDAIYSEGSFFTYIIECGIQSIILFGLLAYYCWTKGVLCQTLFLFYILVSFVLPIGFSTPFCFLFFGLLGAFNVRNENHYSHHKLQQSQ